MYKQVGMEGALGIGGGGTVSLRSEKNLQKAEELFRRRKTKKALPYLLAAIEDSSNIDALMAAAFLLGKDAYLAALEAVADKGKQLLKDRFGERCFEIGSPQVGHFWAILETRPYMRVLQALVKAYVDEDQYIQSTDTMLEMLRLCPGDNTSQRTWLGSNLIRIGRHADALYFSQQRLREWGVPSGGGIDFKPPQEMVIPPETEEKLSWLGNGALLYTAALASFKMWGDCPKSSQYLRIAARANPSVLVKILACVSRPVKLNYDARVVNGPEEAHDYLWLTQDLWMVANVWCWANSVKEAREAILKTCSCMGCETKETAVAEFKRCSACHLVAYCGVICQKKDWPHHKIRCHLHKEEKVAMRAFQMGKPPPAGNKINVFGADFAEGGLGCITDASLL